MESEQITSMRALQEVQDTTRQRPRRARRKALPASVIQKAWLVLLTALAMVVLEGAFRKWVFPQGGTVKYLMYFSKDIIFAALLFYPKRSLPSPALKIFENWLVPGCFLLLAGAVLSSAHGLNPVGALLTARACVILPVIAWLAVPRLAGLPLRWIIWLLVAFTVLNFALGVEQNRLPSDHILNRYSETGMDIVAVESGVRATGTFSYISGMAIISSVGIWAGLALMSLAKNQWQRLGAWAALAAGFGCGLASVSRAPIMVGVAMVAGWMVCSRAGVSALARGLVAAIFCVVIATGFGITPVFSELGQGLMQRAATGDDSFNERAFGQLNGMVAALQMAPWGHGFGTEQVGGQYYATGEAGFNHFESPLPRLVMETGALGLIGYLLVCAGALLALQHAKREASAGTKAMLLATQMFLLPMFYGNVIFNHTASAFVWIIFAAVMAGVDVKTKQKSETLKPETGNEKAEVRRRRTEEAPFSATRKQTLKPET
jgi:hypothetical protein